MSRPQKSKAQRLSALMQWWLQDREVEVTYSPNLKGRGNIVPDFDPIYVLGGERIVPKALAMIIQSDLMTERDTNHTVTQVYAALVRFTFAHFIQWRQEQKALDAPAPEEAPAE